MLVATSCCGGMYGVRRTDAVVCHFSHFGAWDFRGGFSCLAMGGYGVGRIGGFWGVLIIG